MDFNDKIIAFLDTETGGFSSTKDALCSVGLVIQNGDLIEEYEYFIKPYEKNYSEGAFKVNGITQEHLEENGEPLEFVADLVNNHLQIVDVIVAHNLPFDKKFLTQAFYECSIPNDVLNEKILVDTLKMAREKLSLSSNRQGVVCNHFGIDTTGAHTALADCQALRKMFHRLIEL